MIMVGGIHAVGKTSLLMPACLRLHLHHATASNLIKEQRGFSNWTASKTVSGIDENQHALISAVNRLTQSGERVVLDGHFVLRSSPGIYNRIDLDVFFRINPKSVLLIEAPAEIVADRLLMRGDTTWSQPEIELFAQAELEHADFVCRRLGVPLFRLFSPTEEVVYEKILHILGGFIPGI